ncbi:hypothetical protein L195_g000490 [Trifolium pratense]|uniref:Uncharacterized protein n=1 Tax=Trifolium pratense TaxID=57577 RepID=A0A2K3NM10_TRIPR|nr:hypothetical protein L195_g000490 [Trifolium pratense]
MYLIRGGDFQQDGKIVGDIECKVTIDAELDMKDHGSVLRNYDRKTFESFDVRTDLRIRLGGSVSRILVVGKKNSVQLNCSRAK